MTHAIVISNTTIGQDEHGRYCLNHLHKAAGGNKRHQPANWLRTDSARALIAELKKEAGSEVSKPDSSSSEMRSLNPVNTVLGKGYEQGTYAVKELVYAYAMWISPKFHLHVIRAFDGQQSPALPAADAMVSSLHGQVNALYQQLGERNEQIIGMLQLQQQSMAALNLDLRGQVTKLTHQVERLSGKVITTQGQLIRTQKHVTTLVEGRMDGAQASATIVQMHRDGHSNAQIVAATGRNNNHVRQKLWQARRDGVLPPLEKDASAQTALFEGA